MGRKPREYSSGFIFHVFQRGINREYIFKGDESKGMLIHIVKETNERLDFELLGFVIMDNHYHFILKLNQVKLEDVMFCINNAMAHYLKKVLNRTGHIYESRYKCKRVESEGYLLWLLRYIHRNPVRAKIVPNVDDYKWSSHYFYKNMINSTVKVNFILSIISEKKSRAIIKYMHLMNTIGDDTDTDVDYTIIKDLYKNNENDICLKVTKTKDIRVSLDEICEECFKDDINKSLILSGCRKRSLTELKLAFIQTALEHKYSVREIADYLHSSESTIRMTLSRAAR